METLYIQKDKYIPVQYINRQMGEQHNRKG